MENMGAKRRRKMKGGRTPPAPAAAAVEGVQKLSTRYEGAAESSPSNYDLLSVGGKVGADKNGGDGGSFGGGGSGSVIIRPPHCVTETSVHGCVIVYI